MGEGAEFRADAGAGGSPGRAGGCWLAQLIRMRLSAMVALSSLAGWALQPKPNGAPGLLFLGVFLLAASCTALNQVQERNLDARMTRTRRRPLPAGRIRPRTALLLAGAGLVGGGAALAALGWLPFFLGMAAALLYNGIYTPLKRRSVFAVLPGALCGALPPLIGWSAAGGQPADFRIVLLAGMLFLWQVPHFWFFAEKHRDDYRRAGLPVPADIFSAGQRRRLTCVWLAALLCGPLAFAAFGLTRHPAARFALFAGMFLLAAITFASSRRPAPPASRFSGLLNTGMALVFAAVITDSWFLG